MEELYAKPLQSCPTLCDPIDGSPPGFPVPGILQARTLEWVAISFSNAWKWKEKVKSLSRVPLLATPWIAAYQTPPSMGFSRQQYWSGVPLPSPNGGVANSKVWLQGQWSRWILSKGFYTLLECIPELWSTYVIQISTFKRIFQVFGLINSLKGFSQWK